MWQRKANVRLDHGGDNVRTNAGSYNTAESGHAVDAVPRSPAIGCSVYRLPHSHRLPDVDCPVNESAM